MSSFKQRLRRFFDAKTAPVSGPNARANVGRDRYVPRAFSSLGPGWGVFDRWQERFLTDREARALTEEALMDEQLKADA